MKGIALCMALTVLLGCALTGAASDRFKVAGGLNMRTTSVSISGESLAWADETKSMVQIYSLRSGETQSMNLPVKPHNLRLTAQSLYFLGDDGFPYSLYLRSGKVSRLDTLSTDGIVADDSFIAWYNADRIIIHDMRLGKRIEFKAEQMIRDAAVSGQNLAYVDGLPDHQDILYVVNLRNGRQSSYKLYNIESLALDYPYAAVLSVENNRDGLLRVVNLESESVLTTEDMRDAALFQANQKEFGITSTGVVYRATESDDSFNSTGIFFTEFEGHRTMNISRDGFRPVVAGHWAAWLESGEIWAAKITEEN